MAISYIDDEVLDLLSYSLGCLSVLIWLCAQMPQIIKNLQRKSVEGLSPKFLAAWIAGDVSNLIGCILTGQLGVQVLLASYYCMVDVILITQFVLYRSTPEYIDGCDPNIINEDGDTSLDNSNHIRKWSQNSFSRACGAVAVTLGHTRLPGTVSAAPVGVTSVPNNIAEFKGVVASIDIGMLVAYFSMTMYITSRLPQILHNFQRKSTTGISMLLFKSAAMGNLTYTLSILLAPQSVGKDADTRRFLLNELPYILGAVGTIMFDCVILAQWYYYKRRHRRRSTQLLDRMARPYLGTPRPPGSLLSMHATNTSLENRGPLNVSVAKGTKGPSDQRSPLSIDFTQSNYS